MDDRTETGSLATFSPTRAMRCAGVVAVLGGLLILWAFASWNPFADPRVNSIRLFLFWTGGAAVALAYRGRHATRPLLGRTAAGSVVLLGAWNGLWVLLAGRDIPSPLTGGDLGLLRFVVSFLGWLAASLYGAAILADAGVRHGMDGWTATITQLAAPLLVIAGVVATFGMDRLGLTRSEPYGELFGTLGAVGVGGVALGWLGLGLVLALHRGRPGRHRLPND